jgi:hypothetical protein
MCYKTQILCSLLVLLATVATVSSAGVAGCSDGSALSSVALTFVKNVAGIGVNEYNVTSDCKGPMESLLYPGHTEALVSLILSDASSQLEMERIHRQLHGSLSVDFVQWPDRFGTW